jgi:hypothetical protein
MTAPTLAAWQAAFAAALRADESDARPAFLKGEAARRFRVYRNNVYHGLPQALAAAYPVVRRLVGDDFFFAAARAFVVAEPPRERSLALFGAGFPAFLDAFPPAASLPYLADVARLERAWLEAMHAADAGPLAPAALAGREAELTGARFAPHPALRLVASPQPIVALWRANQGDAAPAPRRIEALAEMALVTRPHLAVEVHALTPAQAAFAGALAAGADLAAADTGARAIDAGFDPAAAFRLLLVAGAFAETIRWPPAAEAGDAND